MKSKRSEKGKYEVLTSCIHLIKNDFLFGLIDDKGVKVNPTLKFLADKYNVSLSGLMKYSAREKWSKEKQLVESKITARVHDKKSEYAAEKIVGIDKEYEDTFAQLRKNIKKKLLQYENDERTRSSDLLNCANALIICYEGEKIANGEVEEKVDLKKLFDE